MLEVPSSLPAAQHVRRWFAEPVKALLLPTSVFVTNRKGFPTLPKAHQALLLQFFGFGVQVCLFAVATADPLKGHCYDQHVYRQG